MRINIKVFCELTGNDIIIFVILKQRSWSCILLKGVKIMENRIKYFSTPAIVLSIFSVIFAIASFLTLTKSFSGFGTSIIFWGSIATTSSAIIVPLLSLKVFKLDSYKIKLYSLFFGIVMCIAIWLFDSFGNNFVMELKEFANKGLIWGLNTALLLLNLTYLEIENNDLKNQEKIKYFLEKEEELNKEKEKNIDKNKELLESQREILRLKKALIAEKGQNKRSGEEE